MFDFGSKVSCQNKNKCQLTFMFSSEMFPHAPITPNFPFGSSREIAGDYVKNQMMGPPIFSLLQPEMPTDGVETTRCHA